MKHSSVSKKLPAKYIYTFLALTLLIAFFVPVFGSNAQTASQIRSQINQKNNEISELEKQIKGFQSELVNLSKEKNSLNKSIQELDITRRQLNSEISITQAKIDKTNLEIRNLSSDILDKEESIENDVKAISLDLRRIAELEYSGMTEVILSNNDFTSIWTDIDNMVSVRKSILQKMDRLRGAKIILEDDREETIEAKNKLVSLRTDLSDQKEIVDNNKSQKNKLLSQTKSSESNYQKLLQDRAARINALEQEISDFESQLQFILDPNKLPGAGVLAWPLDYIFVTQHFGEKDGPHRIYANGHSGTDFRARTPLKTYAMASGTVVGTGNTDITCPRVSFGKWVLIKYDNGLASTSAHLSLIKVKKGQRVNRGDVIGYTGNTGRTTAPHLHISLYAADAVNVDTFPSKSCPGKTLTQPLAARNAYLDVMFYLPKL